MSTPADRFDAFISYSHAADGRLAPAVQAGLQRLAKGVFQRRALRVFRDETGLSTNPHLWGSIESALDASEWFVLLASPESSRSEWVQREVATWLERKPLDHLLVVVTDGALGFDVEGRVDRQVTTCLPEVLIEALASEPRWLDLRWAREDAQLDLRNGRFRAAVADLAAPIHGVAKDDLESEDVHQQRRARRLAGVGVTAVGVLAIVSTVAALVAIDQRREADTQRTEAEAQRGEAETQRKDAEAQRTEAEAQRDRADDEANRAIAKSLAAQATALATTDLDLSLLLAAEGYRRDASLDTEAGLLRALDAGGLFTSLDADVPEGIVDMEVPDDASTIYALRVDGTITAHDPATLEQRGEPLVEGIDAPWALVASAGGERMTFNSGDGSGVLDLATGDVLLDGLGQGTTVAEIDATGRRVAVFGSEIPGVLVIDVATGETTHEIPGLGDDGAIFLTESRLAVQELGSTVLQVFDLLPDGQAEAVADVDVVPGGGLALSPDGATLVAGGLAGTAMLVDTATLTTRGPVLQVRGSRTGDFSFSPDGRFVVLSSDDGSATVVEVATGATVADMAGMTGTITSEFVSLDEILSVSLEDGTAARWSVTENAPIGVVDSDGKGGVVRMVGIDDGDGLVIAYETGVEVATVGAPRTAVAGREFGPLIRALDVAESAGLVAAYRIVVDEEAQEVVERSVHVMSLDDLSDVHVVDIGEDPIENIRLSPDGDLLALGYRDGHVAVVESSTGAEVVAPVLVDEYPCCIGTLVWSADGSRLHVGGQDGTVRTFDTSTWEIVGEHLLAPGMFALRGAVLTDDGSTVVLAAESGEVFLLDATTGEPIGDPFIAAGTQLQTALITADGTRLLAEGRDGALRMWDVETGRSVGPPIGGHFEWVSSMVATGPTTILTGGAVDQRLITWDLDPATWLEKACALAGRNLTQDEWDVYVGGDYRETCDQWPAGT